jgi:dsRNA-specific ribonuclease
MSARTSAANTLCDKNESKKPRSFSSDNYHHMSRSTPLTDACIALKRKIYRAPRDETFTTFITGLIRRMKISDKYIPDLIKTGIPLYTSAFTHSSADANDDYEVFEFAGDKLVNYVLSKYILKKFANVPKSQAVKIFTRIQINMQSKKELAILAEKLGFFEFISSNYFVREKDFTSLLEDVFEAFIGASDRLFEMVFQKPMVGLVFISNMLFDLWDEVEIKIDYDNLFDSKTRLKELCELIGDTEFRYLKGESIQKKDSLTLTLSIKLQLTVPEYTISCPCDSSYSKVYYGRIISRTCPFNPNHRVKVDARMVIMIWSEGSGRTYRDAEHMAAESAISRFQSLGITRDFLRSDGSPRAKMVTSS